MHSSNQRVVKPKDTAGILTYGRSAKHSNGRLFRIPTGSPIILLSGKLFEPYPSFQYKKDFSNRQYGMGLFCRLFSEGLSPEKEEAPGNRKQKTAALKKSAAAVFLRKKSPSSVLADSGTVKASKQFF